MIASRFAGAPTLLAGLLACGPASAQWSLFENFENDALGLIDDDCFVFTC